jgi:hypothetical protein
MLAALMLLAPSAGRAEPAGAGSIRPGAVELGIAGALSSVEGSTNVATRVRSGSFAGLGRVTAGAEAELGYEHMRALDRLDALATLSASFRAGGSSVHPYLGATGGLRQEWVGSFRQSRFPLGACVGVRALVGERVGLRVDYRWLRVLDDPVADFTEQTLGVGLSIFFRNAPM